MGRKLTLWMFTKGVFGFVIAAIVSGLLADVLLVDFFGFLDSDKLHIGKALLELSNQTWGPLLFIVITVFVGCLAFALRQHAPDVYGGLEVGFGAVTAAAAFKQLMYLTVNQTALSKANSGNISYIIALAGSIYVIVRGLDNISKDVLSERFPEGHFKRLWTLLFLRKPYKTEVERVEPHIGAEQGSP